jgi:hypothetical protein
MWKWIDKNKTAIRDFAATSLDKLSSALGWIKDHFDDIRNAAKLIFGIWLTVEAVAVCQGIATAFGLASAAATGLVTALGGAGGIAAMGAAFTAWLGPIAVVAAALAGLYITISKIVELMKWLEDQKGEKIMAAETTKQVAQRRRFINAGREADGLAPLSNFGPFENAQESYQKGLDTIADKTNTVGAALPENSRLLAPRPPPMRFGAGVNPPQVAVGGGLTIYVKQDGSIRVGEVTTLNSRVPVKVVQEVGARTAGLVTQ